MSKKRQYPRSQEAAQSFNKPKEMYVAWNEEDGAATAMSKGVDGYSAIQRSTARWNQDLSDLSSRTSGRPGLDGNDYARFRPQEAIPTRHEDIMCMVDAMYNEVGLIRNIVDLMGDFACQGIRLVHPNKRIEKFYRNWFDRIGGKERSERFLNYLYRNGNIILRVQNAKINLQQEKNLYKSVAKPEVEIKDLKVNEREIPWKYTFINPALVDVVGGPLSSFASDPLYVIRLPNNICNLINSPRNDAEKAIVAQLPDEVKAAASNRQGILLPPESTRVFHYKKDDWCGWAKPMIYAIMDDIMTLQKLKLADRCALDGAISNIRIFKIGSLEHKLAPTEQAASYLAEILGAHTGGGTIDLIWGPDIELVESSSTVHQFLGEEKYRPHLQSIYSGLGIPPTLTGTFGGGSGTTNNFISIKTLLQRLEYGRNILLDFWNEEIVKVQKAMGFRFPAKVEFSIANLGDEVAEKALLVQLLDREMVSEEVVQTCFGLDADMEEVRKGRERRERKSGKRAEKAGAFHDPQFGIALKKVALQSGISTPGEVGLRLDESREHLKRHKKEKGEKNSLEVRNQGKPAPGGGPEKKKGVPGQGRPKNKKDSTKRKTPVFKPKNKAVVELWARAAQVAIAEAMNPILLGNFEKSNMRSLSADQTKICEELKFDVLFHMEPCGDVGFETIHEALARGPADSYAKEKYKELIADTTKELDRNLTMDEQKHIQAFLYTEYYNG